MARASEGRPGEDWGWLGVVSHSRGSMGGGLGPPERQGTVSGGTGGEGWAASGASSAGALRQQGTGNTSSRDGCEPPCCQRWEQTPAAAEGPTTRHQLPPRLPGSTRNRHLGSRNQEPAAFPCLLGKCTPVFLHTPSPGLTASTHRGRPQASKLKTALTPKDIKPVQARQEHAHTEIALQDHS